MGGNFAAQTKASLEYQHVLAIVLEAEHNTLGAGAPSADRLTSDAYILTERWADKEEEFALQRVNLG